MIYQYLKAMPETKENLVFPGRRQHNPAFLVGSKFFIICCMSSIYQNSPGILRDISKFLKTKEKILYVSQILELSYIDFKISTVDNFKKVDDKLENFKRKRIFEKCKSEIEISNNPK